MKIVNELSEQHIGYWSDYNPVPIVMKAPAGMDDCVDCAAVGTTSDVGGPVIRVAWKPEPGDVAALAAGGTVWLSSWGGLPPHMLEVQAPTASDGPLPPLASIVYDTLVGDGEDRGFVYGDAELAECRREARLIAEAIAYWARARESESQACDHDLLPGHCAVCKPVDA